MTELVYFLVLSGVWAAVLLGLHRITAGRPQYRLESTVAIACVALAVAGLACVLAATFARAQAAPLIGPVRTVLAWAAPFAAGAAWAGAVGSMRFGRAVAAAVACYIALAFIGFEIGKIAHDAEMREFFRASGLPLPLMYAVLLVETAAACALLINWRRLRAAAVLCVVMIGAVGTHVSNGDPAIDSLDAVRMFTLCAALLMLEFRLASHRASSTPLHVQAG